MDEKRDASLFANMIEGEIADCKWCARFPGNVHAINMTHDSWMKLVAALRAKEPGSAGPGFESWLRSACFQKPTPEAYDLAKEAYVHSWAACREAAAKVCDEVGRDWKREGYDPKLYASEYLAEEIRAIQPPKE